ncbi:MAG: MFS transporter [Thermoplasmata archaeon]
MGTRPGRAKRLSAGLTFNVYLLGLISLLTDLSSEMVFPLIPFFLLTELGATAFIFGIFEGARESTGSLLKVFSGYWSDRIGRRKGLVIAGYSVSSAMKTAIPFVRVWPELMAVGVAERIGKGLRDAPRDAVLAETTPAKARGKVFGFHRLADTLGAVLGPLIAFVLLDAVGLPFREIFLVAVGPALVAALLTVFIRERARRPKDVPSLRVGFSKLSPSLRRFILIATVFALGHFSVLFLLLRVVGVGLTEGTGILFYLAFNLVFALAALPAGILSDRLGRPRVILAGYLAFAAMAGGLILFAEAWQLLLLFVLFGLSAALVNAVERAFVADLAPPNLRATALGTYHTLTGVARFPASAVAGFLWLIAPAATFAYGLIFSLAAVLLLAGFIARRGGVNRVTETL